MRHRFLVAMAITLAAAFSAGGEPPHNLQKLRQCREDPTVAKQVLPAYQLSLELRRAGGSRAPVMTRLVRQLLDAGDPAVPRILVQGCRQGALDCGFCTSAAADVKSLAGSGAAAYREALVREARSSAALCRLGPEGRRELYRGLLEGSQSQGTELRTSPQEAAVRALEGGMVELVPAIESAAARWPIPPSADFKALLDVSRITAGPEPVLALLRVVEAGVQADVAAQLQRQEYRWAAPCRADSCLRAGLAIDSLRRLGATEAAGPLCQLILKYQPVRERIQQQWNEAVEKAQLESKGWPGDYEPSSDAYLGSLGSRVAALVGDLGDREAERAALGGPTLWDDVHLAETELMRRGLLDASSTVTAAKEPW